jgi:hypothetical protein
MRYTVPSFFLILAFMSSRGTAEEARVVLYTDFSIETESGQPAGWATVSSQAGQEWQAAKHEDDSILVCPQLSANQDIELRSAPLPLEAWRRYRLDVEWRGGLFYTWSVLVRYRLIDGKEFNYGLYPERDGLAPPPVWTNHTFEFIVPSDALEARLAFVVNGHGDSGFRPALNTVRLLDLGKEPMAESPPGSNPPSPVTKEELAEHGGGWGYLKVDSPGRHLLNQAGAGVRNAGVVLSSLWARGKGTLGLTARIYGGRKGRFFDFASPEWKLTDEWRKYSWELPILFPAIKSTHASIVADIQSTGVVELDEPKARAILSRRSPRTKTPDDDNHRKP